MRDALFYRISITTDHEWEGPSASTLGLALAISCLFNRLSQIVQQTLDSLRYTAMPLDLARPGALLCIIRERKFQLVPLTQT